MHFSVLALTIALYASGACSVPSQKINVQPTVTISSGLVAGIATSLPPSERVVHKFLGIPFGKPPVRFKPPQQASPWQSVYDASTYRPACLQQFNYPEEKRNQSIKWFNTPGPPAGESEDCLNLNVFSPASASEGSKAVLFWIHGGSFRFGSGSLPLYDGSSFAANQDVVVVTVNYRTNVFGFPGSPELPVGERNLGLLDQRLALDWVHRNIAPFGGNPEKVTIVGESAGGGSVDALVGAPPDPIPFRAAIMQSGESSVRLLVSDPAASWKKLAEATACPSDIALECLRFFPASKIKDISERLQLEFGPVPDGGLTYADTPRTNRLNSAKNASLIARVPVLIGSNADEGRPTVLGQNDTEAYLRASLPGLPEAAIKKILDAYPLGTPGIANEFERLATILTELVILCPASLITQESAVVGIDTWRFYFNASFPNTELFEGSGAYHTAEINLVFGTYPQTGKTKFQVDVSNGMQEAWARFVKDPNNGLPWQKVPQLGVFGGGARASMDEKGKKVLSAIDSQLVDRRCALYQELYRLKSGGV
ncbi:hypothetical protein GX48_06523 [Paracoccidioides brasiliensis]|nr:hypothetical protein GX48_06523 [Paracoccidioides brasiliensis]